MCRCAQLILKEKNSSADQLKAHNPISSDSLLPLCKNILHIAATSLVCVNDASAWGVYLCVINPLHGLIQLCAVVGDGCGVFLKHSQQRARLQSTNTE